jgi:hypothetical protein
MSASEPHCSAGTSSATHDMGGLFQIVFTFGLRVPINKAIGLGYRFHHMSDARIYGDGAKGIDTHMLELT